MGEKREPRNMLTCRRLNFYKAAKLVKWRRDSFFFSFEQIMLCSIICNKKENNIYMQQKKKTILIQMDYRPKCKMKTIKCLKEITGENFCDLQLSKDFLEITLKAQFFEKLIIYTSSKLITFAVRKSLLRGWKGKSQYERVSLQTVYLIKNMCPEYLKGFPKSTIRKPNSKNWQNI